MQRNEEVVANGKWDSVVHHLHLLGFFQGRLSSSVDSAVSSMKSFCENQMSRMFEGVLSTGLYRSLEPITIFLNVNIMLSADILVRLITIKGLEVAVHICFRPQNFLFFEFLTACDKPVI